MLRQETSGNISCLHKELPSKKSARAAEIMDLVSEAAALISEQCHFEEKAPQANVTVLSLLSLLNKPTLTRRTVIKMVHWKNIYIHFGLSMVALWSTSPGGRSFSLLTQQFSTKRLLRSVELR